MAGGAPGRVAGSRGSPAARRRTAQALPPLGAADAAPIEAFLDATWAESGLARQSLASYRRDLEGFARWRDGAGGGLGNGALMSADRALLFDSLAYRTAAGYSPRSNARLLSSLRAFFAHASSSRFQVPWLLTFIVATWCLTYPIGDAGLAMW